MGSEPWNEDRDAALRALLVERARSAHALQEVRRDPAPFDPRRLQAFIVTAVVLVAVVAGSTATVLLAQQRPQGPAGLAVSQPSTAATPEPAPPTPVPTSTPEEVLPTPAPTQEATESVPNPPQTSVASPGPSSGPLVAPDSWTTITRAELHAFVVSRFSDDPDNAAIWEEQAWLDMRCMAEQGFLYDPIGGARSGEKGLTPEERQNYDIAMYGPQTDQPYDWTTAGCHGRSVHETGQDHAN